MKQALAKTLSEGIRSSSHGSLIPEQLLQFFIERCTSYCLQGKWFTTDPIAQWLVGEYDFPPDELGTLLSGLKQKVKAEAGVELLMPGQKPPPEAVASAAGVKDQEPEVELEADEEEEEAWGGEWDASPNVEEEEKPSAVPEKKMEGGMVFEEEGDEEDKLELAPEPAPTTSAPIAPLMIGGQPVEIISHKVDPLSVATKPLTEIPPKAQPQAAAAPIPTSEKKKPKSSPKRPKPISPPVLSMAEANAILVSLVRGGQEVEPIIAKLAYENVLVGPYEQNLFGTDADSSEIRAARDVLRRQLIVEVDYSQYTGLRKIGGMILSQAIAQSHVLLDQAWSSLNALEMSAQEASKENRPSDFNSLNSMAANAKASLGKLDEVVSALSYIPSNEPAKPEQHRGTPDPMSKKALSELYKDASAPTEAKSTSATNKKKVVEGKRGSSDKIKVVVAVLFTIAILMGVGYYLKGIFTHKIIEKTFNVSEFNSIIQFKEARQNGASFIGIVDPAFWNELSKDEKQRRAEELFNKLKSRSIQGFILKNPSGALCGQSYGNDVRVFR